MEAKPFCSLASDSLGIDLTAKTEGDQSWIDVLCKVVEVRKEMNFFTAVNIVREGANSVHIDLVPIAVGMHIKK